MRPQPRTHSECALFLKDIMSDLGCDTTVSTAPPIVCGPYPTEVVRCPHGTTFYLEPTGEQVSQWARDGVL